MSALVHDLSEDTIADRRVDKTTIIGALIAALSSGDVLVRQSARQALVAMGRKSVPALIAALTHPNGHVRWEAAKALGAIGDPAAAPALVQALEDRRFDVRWLAAMGLIAIGQESFVPLLRALEEHADSLWLRQGAHHVLHDLADECHADWLARVLAALEGIVPTLEAPLAAYAALDELRRAPLISIPPACAPRTEGMTMYIPIRADVRCADGPCGHSIGVILDPTTRQVTHLVVQEQRPPHAERLVPVGRVAASTSGLVQLDYTADELAEMEPFVETEYVNLEVPLYGAGAVLSIGPFFTPDLTRVPVGHERTPSGEVALHCGARVEATDGHAGRVDALLVEPTHGQVTRLVLREGHLWGKKEVTIPVEQIMCVQEDTVYLKLDKRSVEALLAAPV